MPPLAQRIDRALGSPAVGARAMRIAFLSHTAMGGSFVVGSHHFATRLAARGHEVVHISAALSPLHLVDLFDPFVRRRLRRWLRGGELVNGVQDVVPLSALHWKLARQSPLLMRAYSQWLLAAPLRGRATLGLDNADVLIVDEPRFYGLVMRSRAKVVVYRPTDLYAVMRKDTSIDLAERELCQRADVLVATSEGVAAHLRQLSGRAVQVINNGVDFEHFTGGVDSALYSFGLKGPRAIRALYVGSFDSRLSATALQSAAQALPDNQFILAGPGSERLAALAPNVIALGAIAYAALPTLMRECAVGMLPFSIDALNAARSPMKLFEYAAAGMTMAATTALAQSSVRMPTLFVASKEDDFSDAVRQAFAAAEDTKLLEAGRLRAQAESWAAKTEQLMRLIHGAAQGAIDVDGSRTADTPGDLTSGTAVHVDRVTQAAHSW